MITRAVNPLEHAIKIDEDGWVCYKDRYYDMGTDVWIRLGEWLFPTKDNAQYSQVFYHLCIASHKTKFKYETKLLMSLHECCLCNKKVPDGLKMVAMLLESL